MKQTGKFPFKEANALDLFNLIENKYLKPNQIDFVVLKRIGVAQNLDSGASEEDVRRVIKYFRFNRKDETPEAFQAAIESFEHVFLIPAKRGATDVAFWFNGDFDRLMEFINESYDDLEKKIEARKERARRTKEINKATSLARQGISTLLFYGFPSEKVASVLKEILDEEIIKSVVQS